jgi:hypothetical protein
MFFLFLFYSSRLNSWLHVIHLYQFIHLIQSHNLAQFYTSAHLTKGNFVFKSSVITKLFWIIVDILTYNASLMLCIYKIFNFNNYLLRNFVSKSQSYNPISVHFVTFFILLLVWRFSGQTRFSLWRQRKVVLHQH